MLVLSVVQALVGRYFPWSQPRCALLTKLEFDVNDDLQLRPCFECWVTGRLLEA